MPLRWLAAFALFEISIPFPLIAFGEQRVSSSLAAILIAAVPLVVAFLALRFDRAEQPTRTRFIGMLIGLGGVVALVGIDIGGHGSELVGAAAVLVATFGYAIGPLIVKRHLSGGDPLGPVAGALGIASLFLLPLALGGFPTETPSDDAVASVVVLGLICTAFAFLVFFRLIAEIGPSRATIITYVNPVVALALGVAILGEHVTDRSGRRPAADPGRLVAVDGRPRATGPGGGGDACGAWPWRRQPLSEPGARTSCAPSAAVRHRSSSRATARSVSRRAAPSPSGGSSISTSTLPWSRCRVVTSPISSISSSIGRLSARISALKRRTPSSRARSVRRSSSAVATPRFCQESATATATSATLAVFG